jgi:hypothetical protein
MARRNYVFHTLSEENKLRVALDALGQLFDEPIHHDAAANRRFVSDTGQVVRVEASNLLIVDAPCAQTIAGNLNEGTIRTSQMSLQTPTPEGALMWVSLDGKPAEASQQWQLKMATIAANTGEKKEPHAAGGNVMKYALTAEGDAPVLTFGEPSTKPTGISLGGAEVARLYLQNGGFEIVRDRRNYLVYLDTPGTKLEFPGLGRDVYVTLVTATGEPKRIEVSQPVIYPRDVRFIIVRGRTGGEA